MAVAVDDALKKRHQLVVEAGTGTGKTYAYLAPALKSKGKANIHKGAIGTSIDLKTGITGRSLLHGQVIQNHPDSGKPLGNIQLPYWTAIKHMASQCYQAIPLGYMGVDICLDEKEGPLVLEVNGRPGLEIQNINGSGIHHLVQGAF